jgi:hypothetical protein
MKHRKKFIFSIAVGAAGRRALRFLPASMMLCVWFAALQGFAQAPPGKKTPDTSTAIHGTVTTLQDNVATGVAAIAVTLAGGALGDKPVSADTDEHGYYEFKNLTAGTYVVSITLQGFKPATKTVAIAAKQQLTADFTLELLVVAEKVEVKENAAEIATESSSAPAPATVTKTELISIPTPQEKVKDVLPITPGVIKTLDSKLSFKGSDENQSLLLVNSARTTDPVTGSFAVPIPTDAVESFAVYKTPYDAGLGSFSGGLTTIQTKPPEDQWSFKVRSVVPSFLGKEGHLAGVGEAIPGVAFDVPVIRHKLLFSEVFQYEMKKVTTEGLPWPNDISKRQGFNSFSTLEAILSPNHVLTLTVNAFPLRHQNVDISALIEIPASNDLNQNGVAIGLNDKYQFTSGAIFSMVAQYMRFDSNAHGQGFEDMLITPQGYGGNYFNRWSRRGKEFQAVPSYQFARKQWHGEHELRIGADIDYRSFYGTNLSDPIHVLRFDDTQTQQIDFSEPTAQAPADTSVAEFVQDHWIVNEHWSVDLGARLSSETSGWPVALAPRAGVAYAPGKSGRTVIRAGAGIFYGVLPLLAADWATNPVRTITPFDATGLLPLGPPVTYRNAYVAGLNPLATSTLPHGVSTTPRNVTWNTQLSHELRKNLRLHLGYLDSHTSYLFGVEPFTSTSGGPSFMGLTNTASSHYREVEGTVHYDFREHDQANFSYIWSQARGDLNNLSAIQIPFAAPIVRPEVYGILPSDIPNRVITWGIFALPWKLTFSPLADYHTGFPWSPIDVNQQYVGEPNGKRFPTYFSLDLKLYREFRVPFLGNRGGKVHHIRLGVYTLNVTNHGNFSTVYNNTASPNFGQFVGFLYRHEGAIIDFVD